MTYCNKLRYDYLSKIISAHKVTEKPKQRNKKQILRDLIDTIKMEG